MSRINLTQLYEQYPFDFQLHDEASDKAEKDKLDAEQKAKDEQEEKERLEKEQNQYTPEQKEIYKLHQENKDRRLKSKEVEKERDELQKKIKDNEDAQLKADGKLQELLDSKEKELEELRPIKEENEKNNEFFTTQLETALKKLPTTQVNLINESEMTTSKKLEWALKLGNESLSNVDSPDSKRPGGNAPMPDINLDDYRGPEGRIKLMKLRDVNPKLYEQILELKNKT